jgi:general secretion pathway protein I
MNPGARRTRGFTLIEVLVALAIVVIGMAAVMGAITSSAKTVSYLRDKTFAQWVAENQIVTIRLSGQLVQAGNTNGDQDYAGSKWHWRQEVAATEIPGVMRIDVHVRPAEVKGDDDGPWYTTVTGIQGDAVGVPNGYLPDWGAQLLPGQAGNTGNGLGVGTIGSGRTNFGEQGGGGTLGGNTGLGGPPSNGSLGSPSNNTPPGGSTLGQGLTGPDNTPVAPPDQDPQQ